ncbi:hypothetical protein C9374_004513 [Naegleria lovaniensis]|uniref:Uncharacterized protein n=1 Tax=Naegleria lovaniensis TaxID=51637 RepID=A0AA88GLG7_NAELO|nr:uncharacterized protein C9374_004513 [Naegleria lovaniensis]KAG2383176.1 hypothetical protein C9374_004513 [Naegleria lovaniensis]
MGNSLEHQSAMNNGWIKRRDEEIIEYYTPTLEPSNQATQSLACNVHTQGQKYKVTIRLEGTQTLFSFKLLSFWHGTTNLKVLELMSFNIVCMKDETFYDKLQSDDTMFSNQEYSDLITHSLEESNTKLKFIIRKSVRTAKRDETKFYVFGIKIELPDKTHGVVKLAFRHARRDKPTILYIAGFIVNTVVIIPNEQEETSTTTTSYASVQLASNDMIVVNPYIVDPHKTNTVIISMDDNGRAINTNDVDIKFNDNRNYLESVNPYAVTRDIQRNKILIVFDTPILHEFMSQLIVTLEVIVKHSHEHSTQIYKHPFFFKQSKQREKLIEKPLRRYNHEEVICLMYMYNFPDTNLFKDVIRRKLVSGAHLIQYLDNNCTNPEKYHFSTRFYEIIQKKLAFDEELKNREEQQLEQSLGEHRFKNRITEPAPLNKYTVDELTDREKWSTFTALTKLGFKKQKEIEASAQNMVIPERMLYILQRYFANQPEIFRDTKKQPFMHVQIVQYDSGPSFSHNKPPCVLIGPFKIGWFENALARIMIVENIKDETPISSRWKLCSTSEIMQVLESFSNVVCKYNAEKKFHQDLCNGTHFVNDLLTECKIPLQWRGFAEISQSNEEASHYNIGDLEIPIPIRDTLFQHQNELLCIHHDNDFKIRTSITSKMRQLSSKAESWKQYQFSMDDKEEERNFSTPERFVTYIMKPLMKQTKVYHGNGIEFLNLKVLLYHNNHSNYGMSLIVGPLRLDWTENSLILVRTQQDFGITTSMSIIELIDIVGFEETNQTLLSIAEIVCRYNTSNHFSESCNTFQFVRDVMIHLNLTSQFYSQIMAWINNTKTLTLTPKFKYLAKIINSIESITFHSYNALLELGTLMYSIGYLFTFDGKEDIGKLESMSAILDDQDEPQHDSKLTFYQKIQHAAYSKPFHPMGDVNVQALLLFLGGNKRLFQQSNVVCHSLFPQHGFRYESNVIVAQFDLWPLQQFARYCILNITLTYDKKPNERVLSYECTHMKDAPHVIEIRIIPPKSDVPVRAVSLDVACIRHENNDEMDNDCYNPTFQLTPAHLLVNIPCGSSLLGLNVYSDTTTNDINTASYDFEVKRYRNRMVVSLKNQSGNHTGNNFGERSRPKHFKIYCSTVDGECFVARVKTE